MSSEKFRYRVVDASGNTVHGKIVEPDDSGLGVTRRSADESSLLEMSEVAAQCATQTGRDARVLRDDGTVARVYHGVAS